MGQYWMHLPQETHFSSSICGNEKKSFWVIACLGHTEIAGQRWFCGHLLGLMVSFTRVFLLFVLTAVRPQ
jgi:hypothetical protein